jgi:SAM-dependent methyltransferase
VLELGCQWSENLLAIRQILPDKKLTGIDVDEETLKDSIYYTDGMSIQIGDARNVKFPDKSFDVVFTNALLCMNQPIDDEKIINEIVRLAKKYIVLVELGRTGGGYDNARGRVRGDYEKIFGNLGFKVEKRKITKEEWEVEPWLSNGYLYTITI